MSNIDWTQLITRTQKDTIAATESRLQKVLQEIQWRDSEMTFIANQLLALDDGDPTALPGTPAQWRTYRVKVRAWVEGAVGYPDSSFRPSYP